MKLRKHENKVVKVVITFLFSNILFIYFHLRLTSFDVY